MSRYLLLFLFFTFSLFGKNEFEKLYWSGNSLVAEFEKHLEKDEVNYWHFYHKDSKKYKYIFDVKDGFFRDGVLKFQDKKFLDGIYVGQYKKDITRISFRNDREVDFKYKISKNKIVFQFQTGTKKKKKEKKSKEKEKQEKQHWIEFQPKGKKRNKIIVLDPGHGGQDGGAICKKYGAVEKDIVFYIAKYTAEYLQNMGYHVYLTRRQNKFISLRDRTRFANRKNADLFISIHANSLPKKGNYHSKNGIETYFLSPDRSSRAERIAMIENGRDFRRKKIRGVLHTLSSMKIVQSHKLAIDIHTNVITRLRKYYYHIGDGGVKGGPFWVLVGAQMPAILIEVGYVTGDRDGKRLNDRLYRKRLARGIANGVQDYFKKNSL